MAVSLANDHTEWFDWDSAGTPNFDDGVWGSGDGISTTFSVEGTGSLNAQAKGTGRGGAGHSKGATTISGHLHAWVNSLDLPDTLANGGWAIRISSSTTWNTNYGSWDVGGIDTSRIIVNRFQPFVVDTGRSFDRSSSPPALSAVTVVWMEVNQTTNSGQKTVYLDRVFFGTVTRIQGGTSGARGNSSQIAADALATPVFIDIGGTYYILDGLEFGITTNNATYFEDTNENWVFDGQNVADDFYTVTFVGHATPVNIATFGSKVGSGSAATGSGGNTFTAGGAAPFNFVCTDADITCEFFGCTFNNSTTVGGTIRFEHANVEALNCNFNSCDAINLRNGAILRNAVIVDSTSPTTSGALDLGDTDPVSDTNNIAFIGGNNCVNLEPTADRTYNFRNYTYSGQTNKVRISAPLGRLVTINVVGGDSVAIGDILLTGGIVAGNVTINNNVSVTYNTLINGTEIRVYNAGTTTEIDGVESVTGNEFTWSVGSGVSMDIQIHGPTPTPPSPPAVAYNTIRQEGVSFSADTTIGIQQTVDRNYFDGV